MMLELALRARIPIIGVTSDDPVNEVEILMALVPGGRVYPAAKNLKPEANLVYYAHDDVLEAHRLVPEVRLYNALEGCDSTLVVINPVKPHALVFDVGALTAPEHMLTQRLAEDFSEPEALAAALRGLSLKAAAETVKLTAARAGAVTPAEIRRTRALTADALVPGLSVVDTGFDFYEPADKLSQWLATNLPHFDKPKIAARGLLLDGEAGTGKSMAAKYIARVLNRPLYRLDIAEALDKWTGVGEQRVAKALALVDREEPCVLLIDEVDKVFGKGGIHTDTVERILSQLLWWLAEHRTQVLTVMTTNDIERLPKELYRPGRVDDVIKLHHMDASQAQQFVVDAVHALTGLVSIAAVKQYLDQHLGSQLVTPAQAYKIALDFIKSKPNLTSA